MFNIILILSLFVCINNKEITSENDSFGSECLIHNKEYSYEYLYSTNNFDMDQILSRNVYTRPIAKIQSLNKIRWNIIRKRLNNDTKYVYYLKNNLYEKYLCASDKHDDLFQSRRIVQIMKISDDLIDDFINCQWELENLRSSNKKRVFTIRNLKYQEQLYASSPFFSGKFFNRVIYLWHKSTGSKQAKWLIDCFTEDHLWM